MSGAGSVDKARADAMMAVTGPGGRRLEPDQAHLEAAMHREIPLFTLDGVTNAEKSTHYFSTGDGLGLSMLRFQRSQSDDVVLIIHGLTTSSDMFIMPEHYNLVQYLLDQGLGDVWTLDYRMSNRFPYNMSQAHYNMDDIALYDHPAAIAKLREVIGNRRIHVICHCLGSVTFTMSLFGKAVDGITSVIANSVALTPRVPAFSKLKGAIGPNLFEHVLGFPYVSPLWSQDDGLTRGKIVSKIVSAVHRECDVPACHMLSLMWGSGFPALYLHENLDPVTHRRGGDLYGATNFHYHRHALKMVKSGARAVKWKPKDTRYASLPNNYLRDAADIETPMLLVTGDQNRVFADSNIVCHERLEKVAPGRHKLHIFKGYGHQDVFMGKDVARDIFPTFVDFIREHAGAPAGVARATR
jgi:cholesterol oxidase